MSNPSKANEAKRMARRRLLRGAYAVPAVLTVHTGSALAGASSLACFAKMPTGVAIGPADNFWRVEQYTGKVEHKITNNISLSGFYLYNKTDEPCAHFWGTNAFADTNEYLLARRVHLVAVNNTWLPSNNTVLTLRYGLTSFDDSDFLTEPFDPATLGFNSSFINAIQTKKFPRGNISEYGDGGTTFGAMVGGLVVGIVSDVSTFWLDADLKIVVALATLVVVLLVRPQGIFGVKARTA